MSFRLFFFEYFLFSRFSFFSSFRWFIEFDCASRGRMVSWLMFCIAGALLHSCIPGPPIDRPINWPTRPAQHVIRQWTEEETGWAEFQTHQVGFSQYFYWSSKKLHNIILMQVLMFELVLTILYQNDNFCTWKRNLISWTKSPWHFSQTR